MTTTKKTGWQILAFSCVWKLVLIVGMLTHVAGCVTVEDHDCGGGTTIVVVEPPSQTPPDAVTPPDASDPTGPSVPMAAPTVSLASLPTTTLSTGTQVAYRLIVTADASADVQLKKLSFALSIASANPSVYVSNPHLRIVGQGTDVPATADMYDTFRPWHCGDEFSTLGSCVRIVLDDPVAIEAGTSVTLELRVTVNGQLSSGDSLTTSLFRDASGLQEGPLAGARLDTVIKDGSEDGFLWSNDDVWFYDGHDVRGTPVAQTMNR